MELLAGFVIALAIALTGVGAGSMTTPVLILLFGVSPSFAVGTALIFSVIVKLVAAPVYVFRSQVDKRILSRMFLGGLPGVVVGSLLLNRLRTAGDERFLYGALGTLIILTAGFQLYRVFR